MRIPGSPTPDIEQRDDANEIRNEVEGAFNRWCIRHTNEQILRLVFRRLKREMQNGTITSDQRTHLSNVFARTFKESTDA